MRAKLTTSLALAAVLCGCGGSGGSAPRTSAPTPVPADRRVEAQGTRVVLRGDVAPEELGPLVLSGRTRVAFAQRGAGVDFTAEVPFTARLERRDADGRPTRTIRLFETAARTGARTISARGRWTLVVDFGDSPFEVSLTPATRG